MPELSGGEPSFDSMTVPSGRFQPLVLATWPAEFHCLSKGFIALDIVCLGGR